MGYRVATVIRTYYQDGEDAYFMRKELTEGGGIRADYLVGSSPRPRGAAGDGGWGRGRGRNGPQGHGLPPIRGGRRGQPPPPDVGDGG